MSMYADNVTVAVGELEGVGYVCIHPELKDHELYNLRIADAVTDEMKVSTQDNSTPVCTMIEIGPQNDISHIDCAERLHRAANHIATTIQSFTRLPVILRSETVLIIDANGTPFNPKGREYV